MAIRKTNFLLQFLTTAYWVKLAWPAELILLTLTLLMGPCQAMPVGKEKNKM